MRSEDYESDRYYPRGKLIFKDKPDFTLGYSDFYGWRLREICVSRLLSIFSIGARKQTIAQNSEIYKDRFVLRQDDDNHEMSLVL